MTRAEKVAEVRELRDGDGLKWREIAGRTGWSRTYCHALYHDPDRAKDIARKASYGRDCSNCGARTTGCNGSAMAPDLCQGCRNAARHVEAKLGHLEAVREFVRRYGTPPSATDWNPAHARALGHPEKAERFYRDGCYFHVYSVQGVWGSWRALLEAAGFPDRRIRYPGDDPEVVAQTVRLYVDDRLSGIEIAERLGVTPNCVYQRLEVAGVPRRSLVEAAA